MQSIGWWSTVAFSVFLLCLLLPCDLGFRIFTRISLLGKMNPSGLPEGQRWLFAGAVAGSLLLYAYPILLLLDPERPGMVPLFGSVAAEAAGLICLVSGTTLAARAVVQLTAVHLRLEADDHLITGGAYARVRNPIYLGLTLAYLGLWLVRPTAVLLLALVCSVIGNHWRAQLEERDLQLRFGEEFRRYCCQAGRYLPCPALLKHPTVRMIARDELAGEP